MPDVAMAGAGTGEEEEVSAKAIGVIQPPPDMKNIVEKTASFVAKNGPQFEQRILTNERNTTKFAFLQPTSPYFPYYQKKLAEFRAGLGPSAAPAAPPPPKKEEKDEKEEVAAPADGEQKKSSATIEAKASVTKQPKKRALKQPDPDVYTVQPPQGLSIPSLDLDIIKLTAQYVAINGRSFLNGLLTRENRNPQFDFLKGHHYLFGYFTSLVESYSKVANPPTETMEKLKSDAEDRTDILERSFQRLDWEAHIEKERQMNEDALAREKETAAQIDWHDFKVVETIDFNEDEDTDLPPPLSESELRAMRLKASTAAAAEEAAKGKADDGGGDMEVDDGGDMDMDEDDAPPPPEPEPEPEPLPDEGPMKIVKDYVPGQGAAGGKQAATGFMISPITGQQVPVAQMAEHMRIALLDPKWKEKSGLIKPGEKEDTLAQHDEVSANLARMASKRKDIFGTDEEVFGEPEKEKKKARQQDALQALQQQQAQAAQQRQQLLQQQAAEKAASEQSVADIIKRAEAKVAGAITAMPTSAAPPPPPPAGAPPPPPPGGAPPPPAPGGAPPTSAGAPPPPPPGGAPPPPTSAPASAPPPVPPAIVPPVNVMGSMGGMGGMPPMGMGGMMGMPPPPGMAPGMPHGMPPGMMQPPPGMAPGMPPGMPLGMAPPGMPAPGMQPPPGSAPGAGAGAPAEAEAGGGGSGLQAAEEWMKTNPGPITVSVQVPQDEANAKFNFNGQTLSLTGMGMAATVKDMKERLQELLGGLAANKMKVSSARHGVLKDQTTLATYNFSDGEAVLVGTKERGGRK